MYQDWFHNFFKNWYGLIKYLEIITLSYKILLIDFNGMSTCQGLFGI